MIHEYKERKVKIKILEKKLVDLNNNAQSKESQIEKLHSSWLPKLNDLVGLLSMNFKKFLMTFGCNGVIEFQSGVTRVNIVYLIWLTIIVLNPRMFIYSMISNLMGFQLKCNFAMMILH